MRAARQPGPCTATAPCTWPRSTKRPSSATRYLASVAGPTYRNAPPRPISARRTTIRCPSQRTGNLISSIERPPADVAESAGRRDDVTARSERRGRASDDRRRSCLRRQQALTAALPRTEVRDPDNGRHGEGAVEEAPRRSSIRRRSRSGDGRADRNEPTSRLGRFRERRGNGRPSGDDGRERGSGNGRRRQERFPRPVRQRSASELREHGVDQDQLGADRPDGHLLRSGPPVPDHVVGGALLTYAVGHADSPKLRVRRRWSVPCGKACPDYTRPA